MTVFTALYIIPIWSTILHTLTHLLARTQMTR